MILPLFSCGFLFIPSLPLATLLGPHAAVPRVGTAGWLGKQSRDSSSHGVCSKLVTDLPFSEIKPASLLLVSKLFNDACE